MLQSQCLDLKPSSLGASDMHLFTFWHAASQILCLEGDAYRNVGTEPLNFRIAVTPNSTDDDVDASWVSVDQNSGIIFPGQFVEITVNYATAALHPGNYDAVLTIYDTSTVPEQSLSRFHLTMQVYCAALDITQPALVCSPCFKGICTRFDLGWKHTY